MELVTWRISQAAPLAPGCVTSVLAAADYGPRWLIRPEIAALVEDILFRAQDEWRLLELDGWVILPNDVHFLARMKCGAGSARKAIREVTENLGSRALALENGTFWQSPEQVLVMECEADARRWRLAMERSPVAAGLVARPEQWFFSSFSRRFLDYPGAA